MSKPFAILLFFGFLSPQLSAQIHLQHSRTSHPISLDSILDSRRTVFVEFSEPPLFSSEEGRGKLSSLDVYTNRRNAFIQDVGLFGIQADDAASNHVFKLVHGMEITLSEREIRRVASFSYVTQVHDLGEYSTMTTPWSDAIRAPQAWSQFDTQGENVKIGILDSGIDYTHPDLSSRYRGGWDVVDNDADPMDRNSHGTHVAGIIRSVAPAADLYAYRVLDERGRGSAAEIIQGLERAVEDGMDVVNMSLGSNDGSPFDMLSQAVDQAVRMGVVVVVASGNVGFADPNGSPNHYLDNGSLTVGSPASATQAITVGSSTLQLAVSEFSSKGPTPVTFHLKPEVLAPGQDVVSTMPGGGYASKSGTSMAAPHVAGLAALVLSRHPQWTPSRVKSVIVSTAGQIQAPAFHQGSGVVDAVRTLSAQTAVIPSTFSFGRVPASSSTVWVVNLTSQSKTYSASVTGTGSGITLTLSPQQFSIAAGDSIPLTAQISISESAHPNESGNVRFYSGYVRLQSGSETTTIPWLAAKSAILQLGFTESNPYVVGIAQEGYFSSNGFFKGNLFRRTSTTTAEVYALTFESYRLAALFNQEPTQPSFVISPSVAVGSQGASTTIANTSAVHAVRFSGTPDIPNLSRHVVITHPEFGYIHAISQSAANPMMRMSTLDPSFIIAAQEVAPAFQVAHPARAGLTSDIQFTTDPSQIRSYVLRFKPMTDQVQQPIVHLAHISIQDEAGEGIIGGLSRLFHAPVADGFADVVFRTNEVVQGPLYASSSFNTLKQVGPTLYSIDTEGPYLLQRGNRLTINTLKYSDLSYVSIQPGDTLSVGIGPVFPLIRGGINVFGQGTAIINPLPRGAIREVRYPDFESGTLRFLNQDGSVRLERSLSDNPGVVDLPPDRSMIDVILRNHRVGTVVSTSTLRHRLDMRLSNPSPPILFMMALVDGKGQPKERFKSGEPLSLVFSSGVSSTLIASKLDESKTRVWFRRYGTQDEWESAPVQVIPTASNHEEGSVFRADLTRATRFVRAGIELRVEVVSPAGVVTEMTIQPAFAISDWQNESDTGGLPPDDGSDALRFVLHQNYPNPFNPSTTIRFDMMKPGSVRLSVVDVLGREVAELANGPYPIGSHRVDLDGSAFASGLYILQLESDGAMQSRRMLLIK